MTQYEYNYLKQELSEITYETREVSPRKEEKKNKVIDINEIVYQSRPEWSDVVDSYGGYAQLAKQNINKNDWENGKFDIAATLKGIELISQTECLAIVDISGDLLGDLYRQGREIAFYMSSQTNGHIPNSTNVWGAIPYKGFIYFTDMYSGLYCVKLVDKQTDTTSP